VADSMRRRSYRVQVGSTVHWDIRSLVAGNGALAGSQRQLADQVIGAGLLPD